jgi:hypothetical protein
MRARATSAVCTAVLAAGVLATVAVEPAGASAASPVVSYYKAVSPSRVLDTRVTSGGRAAAKVPSGGAVTFALPSVPAAATSVVLNVTVTHATFTGTVTGGYVTAYGGGTSRPGVSNLNYVKGQTVPNLADVTLGSQHTVTLYNKGGSVDLVADLSGYYLPGPALTSPPTGAAQGGFVAVAPTRVIDTRTPTKKTLAAHGVLSVRVPTPVPADASAVLVNLTETGAKAAGYLTAYSGDSTSVPDTSTVNFPAGRVVPNLALVPLGTGNVIKIYNGSAATTDVVVDLQGYVAGGDPTAAGGTGILHPTRVLAPHAVAKGATYTLKVAGAAGVPLTGVAGVVLNVTVTKPTATGFLSVSASTAKPAFSNLNFVAGQTIANLVQAPVNSNGTVTFYNGSAGTVYVLADVLGYVLSASVAVPATTTSRYLSDLTGDPATDATTMTAHGCADAHGGTDFVLLDVGAQSRHAPLSTTDPGVALALSSGPVRLTYAELVTAVQAYLSGFTTACGAPASARIAVGTSNSGNFTDTTVPANPVYPAAERGTEWFTKVVQPLQSTAPAGVHVIGANDIENGTPDGDGFDDNVTRAQQWETAWFGATSTTLVFNGAASGCPSTYGATGGCNDTWTQAQFYGLARGTGAGAGNVQVLPQIYYSTQAVQWANIDRVGGGGLTFVGSLTEHALDPATFTPSAGWAALRHAISTFQAPPAGLRAVDLTTGSTAPAVSSAGDLERSRGGA